MCIRKISAFPLLDGMALNEKWACCVQASVLNGTMECRKKRRVIPEQVFVGHFVP